MDFGDLYLNLSDTFPENYQDYTEDYSQSYSQGGWYSGHDDLLYQFYILQHMSIAFYCMIFVLGIIGNGLVIWIAGFRMKKTISAVWFLHLAMADFLCCASLPLRIAEWFYDSSHLLNTFCRLNLILFTINMNASVLLLTAMSVDRCVSVMWPFWAKVHRTRKLVRIIVAVIWVLSFLWTGLVFYLYVYYVNDLTEWCIFTRRFFDFNDKKKAIELIRLVTMFVIPFLIILISYVIILIKLQKSKRSQRSQRPYRIISAVILCFFICWSPYYIWPLTPTYDYGGHIQFHRINVIIIILACLNSCINPIIYVFMGQNFKQSFFRSIFSRLERALGEHPNDLSREREDYEHTPTTDV